MRRMYENAKNLTNDVNAFEAGSEEFKEKLFADLSADNVSLERWNEILGEELGVFKHDEKYDYATDMRRQYDHTLKESKFTKIFKTLPDHVFYDIKKPMFKYMEESIRYNTINPTRKHWADDFFEYRELDEWRENRYTKRDLNQSISHYRRY